MNAHDLQLVETQGERITELDAMILERFELQLKLLQEQTKRITLEREAVGNRLIVDYKLDISKDRIDLPTRAIVRGPVSAPATSPTDIKAA